MTPLASVLDGQEVDVVGSMKGANAERYIDCSGNAVSRNTPDPGVVWPIGMANASLGGVDLNVLTPGVEGAIGPNNIGLLAIRYGDSDECDFGLHSESTTAPER